MVLCEVSGFQYQSESSISLVEVESLSFCFLVNLQSALLWLDFFIDIYFIQLLIIKLNRFKLTTLHATHALLDFTCNKFDGPQLYLQYQMLQKNNYFSIFESCYEPTPNPKSPILSAKSTRNARPHSKQSKISLKKGGPNSTRSNGSCHPMRDITVQVVQQHNKDSARLRWMPFQSTNLLLNSPSHQKIQPISQHHQKTLTYQHPSATKLINFNYSNSSKEDLQKTIKIGNPRGQRIKSNNIQKVDIKQSNILDKKAFISNLINYRSSLVSINVQNEAACPRLQESSIMLDFFNPTQSKVSQIHNYLSSQK